MIAGCHGPSENTELVPQICNHHMITSAAIPPITTERPPGYFYKYPDLLGKVSSTSEQNDFSEKSNGSRNSENIFGNRRVSG